MAKYHRFITDGFTIPFNPLLVGDPKFAEVEITGDPNPAAFHAPTSDEDAEAAEAAALARARALVAKADAKAAATKQAK